MKRKYLIKLGIPIIILGVFISLTACDSKKKIEIEANKIVKAVNTKELSKVDEIINGKDEFIEDEELADFFDTKSESNAGIISHIVKYDKIKIKNIGKDKITYKITAPDLSDLFWNIKESSISKDNIDNFIVDYISNAELKTTEVDVSYSYKDGKFMAEYRTDKFINALTGNLVTAYQELIQDAANEVSKED